MHPVDINSHSYCLSYGDCKRIIFVYGFAPPKPQNPHLDKDNPFAVSVVETIAVSADVNRVH